MLKILLQADTGRKLGHSDILMMEQMMIKSLAMKTVLRKKLLNQLFITKHLLLLKVSGHMVAPTTNITFSLTAGAILMMELTMIQSSTLNSRLICWLSKVQFGQVEHGHTLVNTIKT